MARNLMRTAQYSKYGGGVADLKVVEVPVPTPGKDEVLIKVEAASINPIDWKLQSGYARPFLPRKFPHVPGIDAAGEIVQVGSEVKSFKAGDKVVAALGNGGALAEYAVAKGDSTVSRPPEVSAAEAAALPIAGLAAHQSLTQNAGLKLDGTDPKINLLVTAASGGVGTYVVQLAKLANAHVTATCGARNMDLIKSLGADEVIDYKTPDGKAAKSPSGRKYDTVIHCTTSTPWSTFQDSLTPNAKVVDTTPGLGIMMSIALKKLTFSKQQISTVFTAPKKENLELLVKLVKEGKLKPVIDSKYPLSNVGEAWAKSIDGHATGKIIVEP
ncbi:putative quinone-oxidoreductase-like protein [Hibiscus syriacus]|uniref:Quinone-oxidoreductase-like protein n=1 Tax=Hibiscus syriacus TaxID=106335 RepID=A0A6A2Z2J5_HIBSY|nr:putative quinone-oxidoreductase-like protein [Hibiscus syriacus]